MTFSHHSRLFLSQWITVLLSAVPIRLRATFVELLCACLVSPDGWVTRAIGAIARRCHWNTYYKLIERGSIRSVPLARALLSHVQSVLPLQTLNLVIDDTLGVSVLGVGGAKLVLPILSRLVPNNGNRNKLTIALALLRVLAPVLTVPVRLLCDSWFMRGRLVLPLRQRGIHVIAQARIDTALFLPPTLEDQPKRGRRLTPEAIDALPAQTPLSAVWQTAERTCPFSHRLGAFPQRHDCACGEVRVLQYR